jgi:hypothetical protein
MLDNLTPLLVFSPTNSGAGQNLVDANTNKGNTNKGDTLFIHYISNSPLLVFPPTNYYYSPTNSGAG